MSADEWRDWQRWLERVTAPDYREWEEGVRRIGACAHPIHLRGTVRLIDSATGEVVRELADGGGARLMVPCGNRRREWCAPCSRVYQWDTWHLVKAGLSGGKGVPASVAERPRAFVTLTAPSFGSVHTLSPDGPCHPRRGGGECEHGRPVACWDRHTEKDQVIGQPLCGGCFDYSGAVLWNAHAAKLWHRFTDALRRQELPRAASVTRGEFGRRVRVSFVKVTEYQRRGLVHFHAVIRLDPSRDADSLPAWAGYEQITAATLRAVPGLRLLTPYSSVAGEWELRWGRQTDVQAIPGALADSSPDATTAHRVAAYIAKYVTKGAESAGAAHEPLYCRACKGTGLSGSCPRCAGSGLRVPLAELRLPQHTQALMGTAWRLGSLPEYRPLHLRRWAHQFGYGGHFTTKSRTYSTTMAALRKIRADYRARKTGAALGLTGDLVTESTLSYSHAGYASQTEQQIARGIRDELEQNRIVALEAVADRKAEEVSRWWT
jgi:hypothetical protein